MVVVFHFSQSNPVLVMEGKMSMISSTLFSDFEFMFSIINVIIICEIRIQMIELIQYSFD